MAKNVCFCRPLLDKNRNTNLGLPPGWFPLLLYLKYKWDYDTTIIYKMCVFLTSFSHQYFVTRWVFKYDSMKCSMEIVKHCCLYHLTYLIILNTDCLFNIKNSLIKITTRIQEPQIKQCSRTNHPIYDIFRVL